MSTGFKFGTYAGIVVLCLGSLNFANAASQHGQRKAKKPVVPALPSGPTGPVPQIPLDSIAPVQPQVSYENGQLAIAAPNSTLGDILRAVRKQTGAEIDVPAATDRVVTHLGPGPARQVMAQLLNGSRFNYVLLGSPQDASVLTRVVLVAKSGPENVTPDNQPAQQQPPDLNQGGNAGMNPGMNMAPPAQETASGEVAEADSTDENADEAAPEPEQPGTPDQSGVKTPQQLLQEMQQRQLQIQQQQPPGQPPVPGVPQRPQEP